MPKINCIDFLLHLIEAILMQQPWSLKSVTSLLCENSIHTLLWEGKKKPFQVQNICIFINYINKLVLHNCFLNKFIAAFSKASQKTVEVVLTLSSAFLGPEEAGLLLSNTVFLLGKRHLGTVPSAMEAQCAVDPKQKRSSASQLWLRVQWRIYSHFCNMLYFLIMI